MAGIGRARIGPPDCQFHNGDPFAMSKAISLPEARPIIARFSSAPVGLEGWPGSSTFQTVRPVLRSSENRKVELVTKTILEFVATSRASFVRCPSEVDQRNWPVSASYV